MEENQSENWNVQTKKVRGGRQRTTETPTKKVEKKPKEFKEEKKKEVKEEKKKKEEVTHPLCQTMTFTCYLNDSIKSSNNETEEDYQAYIKTIGDISTVEDFWVVYTHLKRPNDVIATSLFQYQLFRKGIQPLWDDTHNVDGGKWMVKCKKEFSSRLWEDLLLAFIGDSFELGDEICGVVLSIRDQMPYDILNVWNKTASNVETRNKVRDAFKRVVKLPPGTIMEYKIHNERKESSFKNSEIYKC